MTRQVIYGAGNTGRRVLDILTRAGGEVLGFIDAGAARLGSVEGLPVHTIADAAAVPGWRDAGTAVTVAVFNPLASMRSIVNALAGAGFGRVVDFFAFYREHAAEFGDLYWLSADPALHARDAANIREVRTMLADEKSRDLLDRMVRFRTSLELREMPAAEDVAFQYFPADIPIRRDSVYFVDCGAYDGDTVAALPGYFRRIEGFECFEADPRNFANMVERLDALFPGADPPRRYHAYGVAQERKELKFQPSGTAGRFSEDGALTVKCAPLDDFLPGRVKRAYLKMDIEGSEMDALRGARKFLSEGDIDVAICVYHDPRHLWEAPLFLRTLHPGYKFYLRLYGECLMETVVYGLRA